jgi:KipI family sensor histidine kinase inhibitor
LIEQHTAKIYRVFMIGFLPGFPYMGIVDPQIALPRLQKPRTRVPAGSVGIAGEQTGIYPVDSPGGWNIIGRTPLQLFNAEKESTVFFQPGDRVKFYPITKSEFENFDSSKVSLLYES